MTKRPHALKGRVLSAAHRAKISAGQIGRVQSPETRAKMSAARKAMYDDPVFRKKMSDAKRGKKFSAERCAAISRGLARARERKLAQAANQPRPSADHIAAMNEGRAKARERRAAEKALRQAQGIQVPRWVPEDCRDLYRRLALDHDEFHAAHVVRGHLKKRKGRKPSSASSEAASPPLRDGPADLLRVRACGEIRAIEGVKK